MYNIKISKEFYNDTQDILDYILATLHNPDLAINFKQKINRRIFKISKNPQLYFLLNINQDLQHKYRYVFVCNYCLIYHYDEANIYIIRMIHKKFLEIK